MTVRVAVERLAHGEGLPLPAYASAGAAGLDLLAALSEPLHIEVGGRVQVPTGLCVALPEGYEGQIRPRSGLAFRSGLTIPNAPGTIDSDYRGELLVLLANAGSEPFVIERGDRIAQLVVAPVARVEWQPASSLAETDRGEGGFGHTGVGGGGLRSAPLKPENP